MPLLSRSWHDVGKEARHSRRVPLRLPSVAARVAILAAVTLAIFGVLVFRLWVLQILDSQSYVAQAENNSLRTLEVKAPRGVIEDRTGRVLVDNRPGLAVGIRPMDVPQGELPRWPGASPVSCTCGPRPCWPSSPSSPGCRTTS